jgi:cellulose synthase/poly-beta-1,6-N-acetylglucosamine synthase-like glycosyltransferase
MLVIVAVALSLYAALLSFGDFYLLIVHARQGRRMLARERNIEATTANDDTHVPLVCVQLPVHNEPAAIEGAIDALCLLDWPSDRLQVMVLDDSSDETTALAEHSIARQRSAGRDVMLVRRPQRDEFKAGALQHGLSHTAARYLAVFDADYRPPVDFLRRSMPVLLADQKAAFVQARLDYRNRDANWLTRAQAMELDTQFAYEQVARNWAGVLNMFNGTGGIWRRDAIEQAGGWSGRSIAEDQDLSLRIYREGWRSRCLISVSAAGELPESLPVLLEQRRRWNTGAAQNLRMFPREVMGRLNWLQAAAFISIALYNSTSALAVMGVAALVVLIALFEPAHLCWAIAALMLPVALSVISKSAGAALATRLLGRPLGTDFLFDLGRMWLMTLILMPPAARSFFAGLFGNDREFTRTPKTSRD